MAAPPLARTAQERRSLGPSTAEAWLAEALEALSVSPSGDDPEVIVGTLSSFRDRAEGRRPSRAAEDYQRALDLVEALVRDADPPAAWPEDPGLLFLVARQAPLPTPDRWVESLAERVRAAFAGERSTTATRHALALFEILAKCSTGTARVTLRALLAQARDESWPSPIRCALLDEYGRQGTPEDLPILRAERLRPEDEAKTFGARALQTLASGRLRRGEASAVASVWLAEAELRPWDRSLPLAAARVLIGRGVDLDVASRALDAAEASLTDDCAGTAARVDAASIRFARAWIALLRADAVPDLATLDREPREPLAEEDSFIACRIAALLVAATLTADDTEAEAILDLLERRLIEHPASADHCPLDQAYFGPFGPGEMERTLRGIGLGDRVLRRTRALLERIERTASQNGLGLLGRREDAEERWASWVYLRLATLELEEVGPPAAIALLAPRAIALERTESWIGRQLLIETHLLLARAHRQAEDGASALQSAQSALGVAQELRESLHEWTAFETAEDRLVVPPAEQLLERDGDFTRLLESRARSTLGTLRAAVDGDARTASRFVHQAGTLRDWDDVRWLDAALDHARRGRQALSRRCLACVEEAEDQLYDRACVHALLGDLDLAGELLRRHLESRFPTEHARAAERELARRDPDLSALLSHPGSPLRE